MPIWIVCPNKSGCVPIGLKKASRYEITFPREKRRSLPLVNYQQVFYDFVNHIILVSFSSTEEFSLLRRHEPRLLLAAINAACRASDLSLFRKLYSHVRGNLSKQVMVQGRRSLELVQIGTSVMIEWYDSPGSMRHLGLLHKDPNGAGVMVRKLGLWPWSEEVVGAEHTVTAAGWRATFAAYLTILMQANIQLISLPPCLCFVCSSVDEYE
ncbi:hypothetical protein BBK36DRAFT_19330 [Trichoderma citrinoviride]|uniref:Uncharacterized protein n=1 Tax=Trichoderma citrinoviride TaxID=58853 RepID=A0A2T4BBJ2_9HYPO|nr:hypothetical protein BBK36DRAFT_19330 [Trichoderma citrinoviride]PTB66687.1 hypothetical protein BBK36DRAFT_19330 [Trichoderma citrinoviride]